MRTAAILLTLAVLAACDAETGPPPEAAENAPAAMPATSPAPEAELPPAPPLWRPDPATDRNAALLDGVPDDPERGVPASLRGLRVSVLDDRSFRLWQQTRDWPRSRVRPNGTGVGSRPPALSREDFWMGSRKCLELLLELREASNLLADGVYRSVEEQNRWYASLRAKEAVYGVEAEEAACERALLQHALDVARGQWQQVFDRSRDRETILEEWADFEADAKEYGWAYPDLTADPEAAGRLELWLKCDG